MEESVNFLANITQKIILSLIFVLCFMYSSSMAVDITGVWDSNWDTMTFWQINSSVTGEYIYDNGVLIGSIEDNIFIGWWKEYNNTQECGPNNAWSGPALFKFSADGLSFTGDWGYCSTTHADLNPDGNRWVGTQRSDITVYTQTECEDANRFWCNGACQITECGTVITQGKCEESGRNWCDGLCQINECDESTTQSDCETSGMIWCGDICQIDECNEVSEECTQEILNAQYEAGKQYCIDNPEVCGISVYTQADVNAKYQEGYEAGLTTCSDGSVMTPATISPELNIHIPVLQYQSPVGSMDLWADFEFAGENNGDMLWKLSDFGQE